MTGRIAIAARDLGKTYRLGFRMRRVRALSDLHLNVEEGSIYGFVGPNGAGKSTTIKILVGLISPGTGDATIFGHAIRDPRARRVLGYLPENPAFHDFLRPVEVLELLGKLSGLPSSGLRRRAEEMLELVGLAGSRDLTVRKFSKGMVQRLGLAQAMLHDPPLLVLDEPMSGLDPIGRKELRNVILGLRERGKTVFFSTHILGDVETICDRVGMLLGGRLVAEGSLGALLDGSVRSVELRCTGLGEAAHARVAARSLSASRNLDGCTFVFGDLDAANSAAALTLAEGGRILGLQSVRENLEQTFVRLASSDARR